MIDSSVEIAPSRASREYHLRAECWKLIHRQDKEDAKSQDRAMDQESSFHCMAKSTVAGGTDRCRLFSSQTDTHAACAIATLRATLYLGYAGTLPRCGKRLSPPFCACRY